MTDLEIYVEESSINISSENAYIVSDERTIHDNTAVEFTVPIDELNTTEDLSCKSLYQKNMAQQYLLTLNRLILEMEASNTQDEADTRFQSIFQILEAMKQNNLRDQANNLIRQLAPRMARVVNRFPNEL